MRDIGVDVKPPTGEWDGDENCPFYGSLRLRGQVLEGTVANVGMQGTIVVEKITFATCKNTRDTKSAQALYPLIYRTVSVELK